MWLGVILHTLSNYLFRNMKKKMGTALECV